MACPDSTYTTTVDVDLDDLTSKSSRFDPDFSRNEQHASALLAEQSFTIPTDGMYIYHGETRLETVLNASSLQ